MIKGSFKRRESHWSSARPPPPQFPNVLFSSSHKVNAYPPLKVMGPLCQAQLSEKIGDKLKYKREEEFL